jgi:dehydrogenase/reductase SDR family member 4
MTTFSDKALEGRVAIITGASRGIGRSIALAYAAAGADMVLVSRKKEALDAVAGEVRAMGRKAVPVAAHMGKSEEVAEVMLAAVNEFGDIDVLVNNAATNPIFGPTMDASLEAFEKIFDVNVKGYFAMCKIVGKHMLERKKGCIINVASTAGIRPAFGLGVYSMSKAAVIMMSKVLSSEWAARGVRVNTIAPGLVKTQFSKALWSNDMILKEALRTTPLGRIGEPEEIANLAVFLASSAATYITGCTYVVDGGSHMF